MLLPLSYEWCYGGHGQSSFTRARANSAFVVRPLIQPLSVVRIGVSQITQVLPWLLSRIELYCWSYGSNNQECRVESIAQLYTPLAR